MDFSQFDLTDPFVRRALAETLAEDNGLDYQDEYIRKALNDEISAAAQPKPIDGERNFLGDTVSRLARGGVQLADTALHAVDTAVGGSETLQGWSDGLDKAKQKVGLLRPDKSESEEGWLKRSYGQALESAPMSAVPWAGAMAGASMGAVAGPAGVVAGGLIGGTLAMGGLVGLGTYGQRKEEIERELTATRPDLTPDEISKMAHDNAKSHAFGETFGEGAGDLASWAILSKVPGGQAIFKGGKAVLAELVKPNAFKAIALGIGKSMPFEVGSEVGTAIWQNEADKAIGVEQGTSTDAALAAIGPALFLSAGMGVAVGGYSANQRRVQYNALNSEDQESRAQAVDQVASTLAEATDQQTANKWRDMALGFVQNNQPIPLDMNLAELSANEPESAIPEAQDKPAETILKAESVDEAIQEAEAEIAKPGWLAPTAPDLEESAWLQQGAASKAYNQGRNELGATPVSRAGVLGQAMEPMQVAPPILTETQEVEESNVGRGKVSGDSGAVSARGEQVVGSGGTDQFPGVAARRGGPAPYDPVHDAGMGGGDNRDQGATGGRIAPKGAGEKRAGVEPVVPARVPATSEEAQADIDAFEDELERKYGGDIFSKITWHQSRAGEASPIQEDELLEYNRLYAVRDKIDRGDLGEFVKKVMADSGLDEKEARAGLGSIDITEAHDTGVYATAEALRDWDKSTTGIIGKLYNHFNYPTGTGPYSKTHGEFSIGGTADRPQLVGRSYDEDLVRAPWNKEALAKAQAIYNAIARNRARPEIDLSNIDEGRATAKSGVDKPAAKALPKPTRAADEPARAFLARKREWEKGVSQTGENKTQAGLPRTDETQAGKQEADIGPNTPDGYVTAKKQPGGKYKLFFTGTRNEVFSGELFDSAKQARDYFKVRREKLKQAHTTPKTTSTSDLPGVGTETAPSPGEAIPPPAAQPSASKATPEKPAGVATSGQRLPADYDPASDEERFYGSKVTIKEQRARNGKVFRKETTGRVDRVLKGSSGGNVFEVVPDGYEDAFRYDEGDIVIDELVDNKADKKDEVAPVKSGRPSPGQFVPASKEYNSTAQGQKDMSARGSRIAMLKGLNGAVGKVYTDGEIESAADENIDAIRDYLIERQRQEQAAAAKPRKDADMADVAETDFGKQTAPEWAEEHATAIAGRVVYHDEETALVEGYSLLTGQPIHAGVLKSSGSRTRVNIAKYTGKMFTDEQKQNLIKQSERVQAEEQRLHEENPDGPFAGKGRIAASEHIPEWVAETVREWTAMLGIKRRIYITTIEDAKRDAGKLHGPFGAIRSASLTNENQMGTHRQLSNGDSYLVLRPGGSKSLLFEVIGHELGHILEKEAWADAPKELKDAVERDFNAWRDRKGISGREWVDSMRAMRSARKTAVAAGSAGVTSETMAPYWKSFSEYFADQTARWAMTSEKPRSVVERFFKRIADKLKRLYAAVAGQKFLPSESMRAYLDSRTEAAMAVRQVSVEQPAQPAQAEAASGERGEAEPKTSMDEVFSQRDAEKAPFWRKGDRVVGITSADALEAYFTPGRVVEGYGGKDRVVKFERDGDDGFWVTVVDADLRGGGEQRRHRTRPSRRELTKALAEEGWTPHKNATEAKRAAKAEAPKLAGVERGDEDGIVEHTTKRGKVLRGRIVTGISYRQAKAADTYTFKKDGGFFVREGAGEVKKDDSPAEVKETAPEKAEAKPKENLAIKRLRISAERLKAAGEAKLNQDRNANTARRARMANNAEADARADIRTAETLLNIVNAQEEGTAGALAGLTSKAQLETLQGILTQAKYAEERKKENGKQDHARPANKDDIKSAVYLYPHFYDYKDLDALIDLLGNKKGWRTKRNDLRRGGLVVNGKERIEMLREALKLAGDDYRFRTVGEHLKGYDRLQKAGITDDLALREALERLVELSGKAPEKNRAQELERALVGQNNGIDFFPTPKAQAKFIVDRAGIEPGMRVLEPSAGTGNLAEEMRAQGGEVEVAEISPAHREVLEAKGFKIVEHDFMDMEEGGYDVIVMNPPFSSNMDIDHVRKAYELLKPGGRVVAIMGEGAFFRTGKKETEFREWLDEVGINEKLPEGFFTDKKELRTTGVNARVVEIDKPIGAETPVFDEKQEAVEAEQADPTETATVEPEAETETAAETPTRLHTVSGYPSDNATKKHMLEAIAEARKELPEPSPKDGFSNAERIDWPKPTTEKSHKIYRLAGNFKLVVDPTGYARLTEDMGSSEKDGSKIPDKVHGKPIGNLAEAKLWAEYYLLGKAEPSGPPHVFRGKNKEYEYTIPNSAYALDNFEKKVKGSSGVKFSERTGPTLESIKAKYAGRIDTIFVHERNDGDIHLASVIVGKGNRQQGLGSEFMADLVAYADANGKRIVLSPGQPDDRHGTTSRARLVRFYKRFGFIENKGRNKDYQISEGMYRVPAPKYSTALPPSARADIPGELTQAFGKLRARVLMRKITVLESQEEAKALVARLGGKKLPVGDTSALESLPDSVVADAKHLANLIGTDTFFSETNGGVKTPVEAAQLRRMRRFVKNDEVGRVIIQSIPVDMMDFLSRGKASASESLHDDAMLRTLFPFNGDNPVSFSVDVSNGLASIVAGLAAKISESTTLDVARPALKDSSAVIANKKSPSLPALDGAVEDFRRRGSLVGNFENFPTLGASNISHNSSAGFVGRSIPQNEQNATSKTFDEKDVEITAKYSKDGAIQGFAVGGKVYLVRDGIEKGHTIPVLKHEFAHIARLGLRGTKPWQALLRSVDERLNEDSATGKALREARKKVPADTDADLITEETLAYAIEDSPEVGLVRRAIAMIKRFLVNMGVSPNIFTVEDWSALAAATLRGQARVAMGEGVRQSVREAMGMNKQERRDKAQADLVKSKKRKPAKGERVRFIRYGEIVSNSTNWTDNRPEAGMSVYSLAADGAAEQTVRSEFSDRDNAYIGTGTVVGYGSDGEPLVSDVADVEKATAEDIDKSEFYGMGKAAWRKYLDDAESRDLFKPVDTESAALSSDMDESFSLEFLPDSLMGNAEFISNLANTDTFKKHGLGGFDVPSKRIVADRMALVVKDGQILDSVVEFIPIDVVNILASEQLSPDVLLHDEAMLTDLFSGNSNQSVFFPVDVPTALVSSVALAIAKNKTGSGDLGRFSANRGTAVATGDKDLPVLGGKVTSVATENFFGVDDMAGAPFEGGPAGETLVDRHNSSPKEVYIKYNKRTKLSTIKNFSPSDPRIRHSKRFEADEADERNPLSWDAPLDSKKDSFLYNAQNKFIDLFRVQDAIQKHGGTIDETNDVRLAEELYHKRSAKRVDDFLINEVKPLMAELAEVAQDEKEFERFLWARHAAEANESLRLRNPNAEELREMKRVALERRNTLAAKDEVKAFLAKEREMAAAKHDVETGEADDSLLVVLGQELDEMTASQTVQEYVKTRARHEGLKKVKPFDGDNTWLSGMKDDEAKAFMRGLSQEKKTAYSTLAAKWDNLIKQTRQTLVEYELEDQETVDSWAAAFDYYVPLNREDMDGGKGIGQGFSVKGASTKGRTGSYRAVSNILANIVMQRERAIVRGEKSTISRALHGLATANPNKDFWSIEIPPTERTVDPVTGMVINKADMGYKSKPNVVVNRFINERGKIEERAVVFNDQNKRAVRMAEALKNLDTQDLGAILGASAKITRFFSAMNTQYNVVFGPVNLVRDAQAAVLNLSTTPLKDKKAAVVRRIAGIIPSLYKAVRAENAGRPLQTEIAKAWREMQLEGGTTGFRDMFADPNERAERLRADILQIKQGKSKRAIFALRQWVSDYNDMLENSTRLAVYMEARESGISKKRAAQLAKDVTLNFNRKGQVATQAGAMYAFFNAAAQGTEKMYRTLTGPAGKKIITGGLLLGAAQTMLLAAAGFEDDEPPEFIRERNLIIPIGDKKYLTVPMPLGFHVIPNLTRVPTEWAMRGFKEPGKAATELIAIFAEAFNPLGNAGFSLQSLAPTPMDPFIALGENKDWTGRPIAKQDFNTLKPTPGHTRARDTASWPSEMVSRALNLLTGGNEYVPGMLSPTPDQIDYLVGQAAGGVGREAGKLLNVGRAAARGESSPAYRIPFVGRFYGNSGDMSGVASRYYTNLKRVNRIALELDGIRENGGNVAKFIRSNPEARTIRYTEATYRNIQKLQRAKRRMLEGNASRSRVEAIDRRIIETMRRFNERTNPNI